MQIGRSLLILFSTHCSLLCGLSTDYSYWRQGSFLQLSSPHSGYPPAFFTNSSLHSWENTSFISKEECPWCNITPSTMPNNRSLSEKLSFGLITHKKTVWSEFIHPGDKMAKSHKPTVYQKKPDTKEQMSIMSFS